MYVMDVKGGCRMNVVIRYPYQKENCVALI